MMEKIDELVSLLGRFGEELGNVKNLIGDIQDDVQKHTKALKKELSDFKQKLHNGESVKVLLSDTEKEIHARLNQLKKEIETLEKAKQIKQEPTINSSSFITSTSDSAIKSAVSVEQMNGFQEITDLPKKSAGATSTPKESKILTSPYVYRRQTEKNENRENGIAVSGKKEWWQEPRGGDEDDEEIDWTIEHADREEMKLSLMIKEGWKKQSTSYEELEDILRTWTGKYVKWQVVRKGKANNGKALFNVRFDNLEDRARVYDMRKDIAEEGFLFVGEALAYVERKERWKMLMTAEKLKAEGRNIEFENRKICVDGEWWKYYWTDGWRKV